jgi:hypothetical protein
MALRRPARLDHTSGASELADHGQSVLLQRADQQRAVGTWGDRKASEAASLHDYGNKDWSGLTGDYYRVRWQTYRRKSRWSGVER